MLKRIFNKYFIILLNVFSLLDYTELRDILSMFGKYFRLKIVSYILVYNSGEANFVSF